MSITFSAGSGTAQLRTDFFGYQQWHEHNHVTLPESNMLYETLPVCRQDYPGQRAAKCWRKGGVKAEHLSCAW